MQQVPGPAPEVRARFIGVTPWGTASVETRGYDPPVSDILDLQFSIAATVRDWTPGAGGSVAEGMAAKLPEWAWQLNMPLEEIVSALELLADDGRLRIRVWSRDVGIRPDGWLEYRPGRGNISRFVGGFFRMVLTAKGKAWVDKERRLRVERKIIDTGDPVSDAVVQRQIERVLAARPTPPEQRKVLEALLSKLVWIAAQNYREQRFLAAKAGRELDAARDRGDRADLEKTFYQPFLYEHLMQVPALVPHVTKTPEQAGGAPDFLLMGEFPLEAKVVYPEESEGKAKDIGLGQVAQYASRSGVGFLSVLDLRPRPSVRDLSHLANDVGVREISPGDGLGPVLIVRVQHVAGLGPPSRVRPG